MKTTYSSLDVSGLHDRFPLDTIFQYAFEALI